MFYALATRPSRSFPRSSAPASGGGALEKFLSDTVAALGDASANKAVDVQDLETSYLLQMDVPGLARDQLDISIEGDLVRVASKADAPRHVKTAWRFPLEIDVASSTAKLEHGVLALSLAKKIPVSKVSQLTIQ